MNCEKEVFGCEETRQRSGLTSVRLLIGGNTAHQNTQHALGVDPISVHGGRPYTCWSLPGRADGTHPRM